MEREADAALSAHGLIKIRMTGDDRVKVMGRRAMGFSFLDADGKGWHAPIIDGTRMPCAPGCQ